MIYESIKKANFISSPEEYGEICPVFRKKIQLEKEIKSAFLNVSALGVYEAHLNGERIGDFILAPGWTEYKKRLRYQTYDITNDLKKENILEIFVGQGWAVGRLVWMNSRKFWADKPALIASIDIEYSDGNSETIVTDANWECAKSGILTSQIYDGETYDANIVPEYKNDVSLYEYDKNVLIKQDGVIVKEHESLFPINIFTAPNGETVVDFGQNLTGYVKLTFRPGSIAKCRDARKFIEFSHAETLDGKGNFYTANLRSAKQKAKYILSDKVSVYKPHFTFYGFRYIRFEHLPVDLSNILIEAVCVHSDMKRTGHFNCSDGMVNRLYQNSVWSQRDNYLDVPTDCPQRDERLGWTGDAQIFAKTASYHFDILEFMRKWLRDLAACQKEDGRVPDTIPDAVREKRNSSACWGDASTVCPWQLYVTYGCKDVLEEQYDSMKAYVEYIRKNGTSEYLWDTGVHYGDWCALDSEGVKGATKGATDQHLIATAFYAYSVSILIKTAKVLGRNEKEIEDYSSLLKGIKKAFNEKYIVDGELISQTQTAHVLALKFGLVDDKAKYASKLAELIKANGNKLNTGFAGTGYLLETLCENGLTELAYTLLLQKEFPSWLFSVSMGATTIWEHWDCIRADGTMWSTAMNSFNHYAYGSVASFMYEWMAGIKPDENEPGFRHIIFEPKTDGRIDSVSASIDTSFGKVSSGWKRENGKITFEFSVPQGAYATLKLNGEEKELTPGEYVF